MKKLLKLLLLVVVILLVLAGGALFLANRYLQSPAFKEKVLAAAHDALGTNVQISELQASLWEGIVLKGVTVANPQGFNGSLLTADAFVLRYRLLPLLYRKLEVQELSLTAPVVVLARNDKGEWNYDKLGGTAPAAR